MYCFAGRNGCLSKLYSCLQWCSYMFLFYFQLQKLILPPAAQSPAVLMLPPQIPAVVDIPVLWVTSQPSKASQSTTSNVLSPHNGLGHAPMAYNMHSHSYCVCRPLSKEISLIDSSSEYNGSDMNNCSVILPCAQASLYRQLSRRW